MLLFLLFGCVHYCVPSRWIGPIEGPSPRAISLPKDLSYGPQLVVIISFVPQMSVIVVYGPQFQISMALSFNYCSPMLELQCFILYILRLACVFGNLLNGPQL